VNARYAGASRVDGSGLPNSTDLFFGDIFTAGFRIFADLNQRTKLIEDVPLLKNTRVTFGVNNVFDERQVIVDSSGAVPLRFQPYLVDPTGRVLAVKYGEHAYDQWSVDELLDVVRRRRAPQ